MGPLEVLGSVKNSLTSKEEGVTQGGKANHQYGPENCESSSETVRIER